MKSIQIDNETAHRLRIFVASENQGKIHGKIGATATKAINQYIDKEEKYIDDLAKEFKRETRKPLWERDSKKETIGDRDEERR